ncbi:MAG: hypothetical protein KME08_03530 [Aphanothece sp. CMT-3BRIN-NPC111]|nr:hypothetical protein [Aphanothece sp. CMT-3BRIN-NPC111]
MFIDEELVGRQEDIELFNNIGCFDNLEGRLTVWLTINQTPKLRWEFEAAKGDYSYNSLYLNPPPKSLTSWEGSNPHFILEKPKVTFRGGRRRQIIGYAEQALYGNVNSDAHYFEFYIPNSDFMREAVGGDLEAIIQELKTDHITAEIGQGWSIEFSTNQKALDWLTPEKQNRGSMITWKINLYQTNQASISIENLAVKSLIDARQLISNLCLMLSYANGGYIQPVYGIARKFVKSSTSEIHMEDIAALAEAPLIAAQEELGQGFIRLFGIKDLLEFIKCLPSFQRMLQTNHWLEKWPLILEWYFQALPRLSGRRRNVLMPVVANALGTLLENLARLILVDEEPNSTLKKENEKLTTKLRINALLNRIGILGENQLVDDFVDIRNNSTHARKKSIILTELQQWEVIYRAVQWVDEVILWRLGYGGQYRERSLKINRGIEPRYDIYKRDPSW